MLRWQLRHLWELCFGLDYRLVFPVPERVGEMAGHRGFDTGLDIHSLGQLKISEGFGASEGNGAIQYLPLFAKDLEIFGKSVSGVLVAWKRDGIPALQQRLIPL